MLFLYSRRFGVLYEQEYEKTITFLMLSFELTPSLFVLLANRTITSKSPSSLLVLLLVLSFKRFANINFGGWRGDKARAKLYLTSRVIFVPLQTF
jgi:hypothetical protein